MSQLLTIIQNSNGQDTVSARELYDYLGYDRSQWSRWSKKNIEANPFSMEGVDWAGFDIMSNGNLTTDFALTLDFAERLCMLARTEKGEMVRRWFQAMKNRVKELSRKELARMIWEAEEAKEKLALENQYLKELRESDRSKAEFYDAVTGSKDVADLGTVAKLLNIRGMGRTKLFAELRGRKVLMADNKPYQVYVDRGWFRVIETKWSKPDGSQHINFKTVVFQKGIAAIRDMLIKGDTPATHTAIPEPHQYDYEY